MIDTRLLAYAIWGIGTTFVYWFVMDRRYRTWILRRASWRIRKDDRAKRELAEARRDLMSGVALFGTALASNVAIHMVLFGTSGTDIRGALVAFALGAFSAAGLFMATDNPNGTTEEGL